MEETAGACLKERNIWSRCSTLPPTLLRPTFIYAPVERGVCLRTHVQRNPCTEIHMRIYDCRFRLCKFTFVRSSKKCLFGNVRMCIPSANIYTLFVPLGNACLPVKLMFLYSTVSTLNPMVGIVVTTSPSLSLYRMVVLPAASRPTFRATQRDRQHRGQTTTAAVVCCGGSMRANYYATSSGEKRKNDTQQPPPVNNKPGCNLPAG